MQSIVTPVTPAPVTYPFLGIALNGSGLVVMFSDKTTGTVVGTGNTGNTLGYRHNCWAPDEFKPFVGSITLQN